MALRSALLNVMVMAARKAARGLARDFGEVEQLQVSRKGPADFVSAADHRVEKLLVAELRKARPDWGFRLEEAGVIEGRDPSHRWVIDPLDGTTNFLHGVPHFAISIGVERDGEPVCGVILDPIKDELFSAEKGGGAFLNDRRLRVSARKQLPDALIATGLPFNGREGHELSARELKVIMPEVAGIRRMGAASLDLAYVAAGRYDGFWERGLAPWDVCAGIVIVREAGGVVTGLQDGADPLYGGSILAANDSLHNPLKALLAKA
jgi:myo-inositol-1(or 4)-monophosphatase